jgi:hypothetical protein
LCIIQRQPLHVKLALQSVDNDRTALYYKQQRDTVARLDKLAYSPFKRLEI